MELDERWIIGLKAGEGNVKHYAIDLLRYSYDPQQLVSVARKHGVVQQLGYLAEATFQAAKSMGVPAQGLQSIVRYAHAPGTFHGWCHLKQNLPDWGKEVLAALPHSELNKKWKVFSGLPPEDIADWIDLYIVRDHATTPSR